MKVNFCEIETSLGTRKLGKEIRENITAQLDSADKIILDFEGVEIISNSFADEFFGKLIEEFGLDIVRRKTTFAHTNREVSIVLKRAIIDRI